MSHTPVVKGGYAALAALFVAMSMSCSRAETPQQAAFTSVGRGAPVSPAIPWEMWRNAEDIEAIPPREIKGYPQQHWLVGPLDGPATGKRLEGFLGAARGGAAPARAGPPPPARGSKDSSAPRAAGPRRRGSSR